jgi:hypothetical protein
MEESSKIFISYRREDSSGYAGRLNDALSQHFGRDRVFMDVDSIGIGVDFVEVVENAVGSCKILIALIGKDWLDVTDKKGRRRLDNPQDLVRVEIETALKRGIKVIPATVQDALMPSEDVLPESLVKLSRRNAIELSDSRWKYDVERLLETLEKELGTESKKQPERVKEPDDNGGTPQPKPEPPVEPNRRLKVALITLSAIILIGVVSFGLAGYFSRSSGNQNAPLNNNAGNSNSGNNAQTDPTGAMKFYEGHINTEQISLRLRREGQFLSGTISNYSTRRVNIQVKGTLDNAHNIVLQELDPKTGEETGIYRGKLSGETIEGTWTMPDGSAKSPFYLKEVH